jgi:hypothetical protein
VQESFGAKTSALKPLQVFGQRVFQPVDDPQVFSSSNLHGAQRRDVPKAASVRYPVHTGLRISPPKTPYNNWDLTRNQDVKGENAR